jgi:hypothetical protein
MDEAPEREGEEPERDPHHALNNPVGEPDPTEWPDPYEIRKDPREPSDVREQARHVPPGATSTSEPHPDQDPEAERANPPNRDRLDD